MSGVLVADPDSLMRESPAPSGRNVRGAPAGACGGRHLHTTMAARRLPLGKRSLSKDVSTAREDPMRHSYLLSIAAITTVALSQGGCARNEAAESKAAPAPQVS